MTEPYDLRSNIKDKPGSQGTLFQVKDKGLLNPQQRWPRGYTPERRDEIAGALQNTVITGGHMQRVSREEREHTGRYATFPQAEARVVDAVSRSTIPPKDLRGLAAIHSQPANGHLATYFPAKKEIGIDITKSTPEADKDEVLVHEIGHHADIAHTGLSRVLAPAARMSVANAGHSPEKVTYGVREGVADNYALKHYRSRRGKESSTSGLYERIQGDSLEEKYPGYRDVRPAQPDHLGPQFQGTLF